MQLPKLDLNVTNRCNFRCVHCAFDSGIWNLDEFSLRKLEEILRDTKELGGQRIDVTGGEPTLREDFADIVRVAKGLGYKVELVTNGSLLDKAKLSELKQIGLDSIAVSLDGSNYDIYSRIRKVDEPVYQKALKTILAAVELGFYVKVNTTVFNSNYRDVPNITQFCISNGIGEHGLYYFTPVGRGARGQELAVEPLEWLSFIRKNLVSLDSKIKISLEVPLIENKALAGREIGCIANAERYHLQILPDGNVYPCAILASYRKPIANLHSKSVKQIWQNSKLWDEYWKKLLSTFTCGYCVDFNAFNIEDYDMNKYKFVCPLRKFRPSELK